MSKVPVSRVHGISRTENLEETKNLTETGCGRDISTKRTVENNINLFSILGEQENEDQEDQEDQEENEDQEKPEESPGVVEGQTLPPPSAAVEDEPKSEAREEPEAPLVEKKVEGKELSVLEDSEAADHREGEDVPLEAQESVDTPTKSLKEELADDPEMLRPQILFVKIRNATLDQVKEALRDIGDSVITLKRDRDGNPVGAAFICMQNSKQSQYLLQHHFEIDFTQDQLNVQREQIKGAIEARKKKAQIEGIDPSTIKDYDEKRGIPSKQFMYVDVADTRSPGPQENGKSLYISNLPDGKVDTIRSKLEETLLKVGDVEDLKIFRNRNPRNPGYYAFARFANADAEYALLMMKDYEFTAGGVSKILSASYARKQEKKPSRRDGGYSDRSFRGPGGRGPFRGESGPSDSEGSWR